MKNLFPFVLTATAHVLFLGYGYGAGLFGLNTLLPGTITILIWLLVSSSMADSTYYFLLKRRRRFASTPLAMTLSAVPC